MLRLVVPLLAVLCVSLYSGIHHVPEGHVGLYWFGGRLLNSYTEPGFHWMSPLTTLTPVRVSLQNDKVTSIPCGTSGGVMLTFDRVEISNRLRKELAVETVRNYTTNYDRPVIFARVHSLINELCSTSSLTEVLTTKFDSLDELLVRRLQEGCDEWAPGVEIIAARVTKPRIPEAIRLRYERMEAERTKLLIAEEQQAVVLKEAETERKRAVIQAHQSAEVALIEVGRLIERAVSEQEVEAIDNQVHLARERAFADAEYYQALREAEANAALLSPSFLALQYLKGALNNSRLVVGDSIPSSLLLDPLHKAATSTS